MKEATITTTNAASPLVLATGKNVFIQTAPLVERWGELSSLETDLLWFAAAVYAADLAIKRSEREDFVRSICLEVPVVNLAAFKAVQDKLQSTLRVLSCDNWALTFKAASGTPEGNRNWPDTSGTTLLFSGGVDSFSGACDLMRADVNPYLVSHVTHNRPVAQAQESLVVAVEKNFRKKVDHLPLMVSCRKFKEWSFPQDADREETQRTRSFLFVALATIAARKNGSRRVLVMAENGQFAIHLPLTSARVGAFSTHTAHPEFLAGMQDLLRDLMLCPDLFLSNPFVHNTKEEVVQIIPTALRPVIEKSISCWMTSRLSGKTHCGECVPCISRRIALEANGLSFDEYKRDIFRENIGQLPPDDNGKRNLLDLLEFIARFHGPHAISSEGELCVEFPELFNRFIDRKKTIAMYRRFAKSASNLLKKVPSGYVTTQMKLSLSELERARKEPKKFAASKLRKFMGIRPTFPMYWVLAAKLYHRLKSSNDQEASRKSVAYFTQHCEAKLARDTDFETKMLRSIDRLTTYFASYEALKCPLVQVNKRVVFDELPGHYLSGRIDRLDIDPTGGYVATNFESSASDWKNRLRIPITQRALANDLGCRVSEVRVGIYCVETSTHSYVRMKETDIKQAISELQVLLSAVETEVKRLREGNS